MMTVWAAGAWCWVWLGMTVVLTSLMHILPVSERHHPRRIPDAWLRRLLRGEMAVGGSIRAGLGMAAALWWCITAGILVSDEIRAALALAGGVGVIIALINAGRRARLSVAQTLCLCGALSAGGVLLLMVLVWLWLSLSGGQAAG